MKGETTTTETLPEKGADVNKANRVYDYRTPLNIAIEMQNFDAARALLRYGANFRKPEIFEDTTSSGYFLRKSGLHQAYC